MNIIILGFKHCGKTSVGKEVAKAANKNFLDTDSLIESRFCSERKIKLKFTEIYKLYGEFFFRDLEKSVIQSLTGTDNSVIALGGGSILARENVSVLKKIGKLFYLNVHHDILKTRIKNDHDSSLIMGENFDAMFAEMYLERSRLYERIADFQIDDPGYSVQQLALTILSLSKGLSYGQ